VLSCQLGGTFQCTDGLFRLHRREPAKLKTLRSLGKSTISPSGEKLVKLPSLFVELGWKVTPHTSESQVSAWKGKGEAATMMASEKNCRLCHSETC
jgi:hypothetical protein